ncbi:MAG: pyridoxamine 5'-phosphate oxidase family protein [Chloroflexota bacterium]|nr:pyridoxamine 5'-phosphate oxidase family protein [Chloroflexota bacterium]
MFTDEQRQMLSKPLIARLATSNADGYPHVVPLWFMLDGDDILIISERNTRKIKNLQANPKAGLTIGGDELATAGYLIQADCIIEEDPDFVVMKRVTRFYEPPEQAERDIETWSKSDMVYIRMKVKKVVKVF